jgi:hypothetical protein
MSSKDLKKIYILCLKPIDSWNTLILNKLIEKQKFVKNLIKFWESLKAMFPIDR